jgi:hypothetical protein
MHPSHITERLAVIAAVSAGVLLACNSAEQAGQRAERESPAAAPPGPVPVIVAPAPGTRVAPGETVRVVVQASSTRVMLVGPETSLTDDAAPFEFDLVIPAAAVGNFPIQAFGASATGSFAESNTVTLTVLGPTLRSMKMVPREMILVGPGSTQSLIVLGVFSDGVERDITDPSTGTIYEASSGGVVSVSPAGVVTALSPGAASVVAWNGDVRVGRHNAHVGINVFPSGNP